MPEPVSVEVDDVKDVKTDIKPDVKVEKVEKKEEPQYVKIDDLKKLTKQLDGISISLRASEKEKKALKEELEGLKDRLSGKTIKPSDAQDELDKLLEQGDWRTPVSKVAESTVLEILKQREDEQRNVQNNESRIKKYEASVSTVYSKYPELKDPDSEVTKIWLKVVNSHPEWHGEPLGPLAAMQAMEDELESKMSEEDKKENLRRARASAGSLKPGSPTKTDTIVLTKEQKEFCRSHDISEEKYLKTLKSMNNRQSEAE